MSRLKRLLHEVHQRSLWQLLASYIVGAWLVLQLAETLASLIGLPLWFGASVIALLGFGLVLVLTTGLVQVIAAYRSAPDRSYSGVRRLFSWKNALIAGVVALAVLVVGTGGYMGMRALGIGPVGSLVARGIIEPRERIVLADFEDNANDPLLALTATVAFRTDLSQSRTLRLAEPDYIDRVLSRMEREPGAPLDYELAREIAVREGLKAVIAGKVVGRAGTGHVLSARLVTAETGEVVVAYRENARDSSEILPAIDRLSRRLRERAGESIRAIRSNPPLEEVTTASLEALKKYSLAMRQPHQWEALPLLLEAVSIDTSFAAAYRKLSAIYGNMGERRSSVAAAKRAYEHRDRLTELERANTIATYHSIVSGDLKAQLQALRRAVEVSDSTDTLGLENLGVAYEWLGESELAEALYRRALKLGAASDVAYGNLIERLERDGKLDEAELTIQEREATTPDCLNHIWRRSLAYLRGDIAGAELHIRALRRCREAGGDSRWAAIEESRNLSYLRAVQGRLAEAEALASRAFAGFEEREELARLRSTALFLDLLDISRRGQDERGVPRLERALEKYPIENLDPLDRPYLNLAVYYSVAGRPDRARAFLREYEAVADEEVRGMYGRFQYRNAKGIVAVSEGRPQEAIVELRLALNGAYPHQTWPWLGRAYELAALADSAIVFYEDYVSTPDHYRMVFFMNSRFNNLGDQFWLPSIYERLGDLYEQRADTTKAIYYYGKLVELWKDADPELQPRVQAARRAIEALSPDR